jgi:hypothetical protein
MGPYLAGEELSLLLLQMSQDVNLCLDLDSSAGGRRSSLQQRPTNRYPFGISDVAIGAERLGSSVTATTATTTATAVVNNTATMPGAYTTGQSTPFSYPSSPLAGYQLRNETSHADIEASQGETGVVGDGQRSQGYGATAAFFTATDDIKAQGGKFEYDGFAADTKGGQGDGKNGTRHGAGGGGGRQSRINSTDSNLTTSSMYSRTSPEGRRASVARRNSAGGTKKEDRKSSTFLTKLYQ